MSSIRCRFHPMGATYWAGIAMASSSCGTCGTAGESGSFPGHTGTVRSVRSSADGGRILSGDSGETVRLWNATGGEELQAFRGDNRDLKCIAISPDGRRALSGGNDAIVRLWDLDSGREVCRLQGHTMGVNCVTFSHDGRRASRAATTGPFDSGTCPRARPRANRFTNELRTPGARLARARPERESLEGRPLDNR